MRRVVRLWSWGMLWLGASILVGCDGEGDDDDTSQPPANAAPEVTIEAPADGDTLSAGTAVTFSGTVRDDRDAPSEISVTWSSSLEGVLNQGTPGNDGVTSFTTSTLAVGTHEIVLEATDSGGLSTQASIQVVLEPAPNESPTARITSPKTGAVFPSGTMIKLFGLVDDLEDDPADLRAQFRSSLTGELTDWLTPQQDGQVSETLVLEDGDHLLTLVVQDSEGAEGVSEAISVHVTPNEPPEVLFEPLDQVFYNEGDGILLIAEVSDDTTDPESIVLQWTSSLDGPLPCPGAVDPTGEVACLLAMLHPGDHVITLVATDEGGKSGQDMLEVTVNGLPSAPEVTIEPSDPRTSDDLRAVVVTPSTDPDGDAVTYTYRWRRSSAVIATLTSDIVPAAYTAKGEDWEVEVIPGDGFGSGPAGTASVAIANTPPELTAVTIAPSSGYSSTTFHCMPSGFYDADGDAESYLYTWLADGAVIEGAEGATYVPVGMKHGQTLQCEVTPVDGTDQGEPVRSGEATIQGRPPSIVSVSIEPATGGEETEFRCVPFGWSDPDGDAEEYRFQWWINDVQGPETETLTGASFNKHDTIRCEATPFDGFLAGDTVASGDVSIENTPPEVSGVSIQPNPAYANSLLRCQTEGYTDVDGDAEQTTFVWTVDGVALDAARTVTLDRGVERGQVVGCTAYVSDGEADPVAVSADPVTISNSPPSITSVAVDPPAGSAETTFVAVPVGFHDVDGDPEAYHFQWYVNDVASVTTASIPRGNFVTGDRIYVEVTPYDPFDSGETRTSATITIGSATNPPSIREVSLTPLEAYERSVFTCTPVDASDPEDDPITFTYAWTRNGVLIAGATENTLTGTDFDKHDIVACTVTPHDPTLTGASVTSNPVTVLNTPPAATGVSIDPQEPTKASLLSCVMAGLNDDDGDEITVAYRWEVNGVAIEGASSSTLSNAFFVAGDSVVCTGTPDDGEELGEAQVSAPVTILGSPPEIDSVVLEPTLAYETSELVCTAQGVVDIDGDEVSLSYAWYNGTSLIAGQSGTTLTGEAFDKGDAITCRVTPTAGGQVGDTVVSNTVVIQNTLPTVDAVTLGPTPAYETTTLTCQAAGVQDPDDETPVLSYSWKVGGVAISWDQAQLDGTYFDRGDAVQCTVVASDSEGSGIPVSSNQVTIQDSPPTLLEVTLGPQPAYTDSVLSCTPGEALDPDGDAVSFLYLWLKNDQEIAGAVAPNLSSSAFQKGDRIVCVVTPTDDLLEGEPVTSNEVVIANAPPTVSSVVLAPLDATETSTLTCTANGVEDRDHDPVTLLYAWTVDGVLVEGADSSTLTGDSFDRDQTVACTVTPDDGTDLGEPVLSNEIVIVNSWPVVDQAVLTPEPAYEDSTLTCSAQGAHDDDPADTVALSYEWVVAGTAIETVSGNTLNGTWFNKNDVVYCLITPSDGTDQGLTVKSNDVSILNSPPTVAGVTLQPDPATEATVMTCTYDQVNDADRDPVEVSYTWTINGAIVAGLADSSLSPEHFAKGDEVWCSITPFDGTDSGTPVDSNHVVVANSPPTIESVEIFPAQAFENSTLECQVSGEADLDGDLVTLEYAWAVDGNTVAGATAPTLTGIAFDKNQSVTCTATPNDGTVDGDPVTSSPREILNTPPTVAAAVISPATATEASTLVCSADTPADVDPADTVTLTFDWLIDGATVLTESAPADGTSALDGTYFDRGDLVTCRITPGDGTDTGTPVESNGVVIENTPPEVSGVTIEPDPATRADTLVCSHEMPTDIDGDTVTLSYAWAVDGNPVDGADGSTLSPASFAKDNVVTCTVTPSDGIDTGTPATSAPLTIQNSPPTVDQVTLTPESAFEATTLTCSVGNAADIDGDQVTVAFAWFINGSLLDSVTTSSITGAYFDRGDLVACAATPNDGAIDGAAVESNTVEILNTAPVVSTVTLTPADPTEASTLICEAGGVTDDDPADTVSLTFEWTITGETTIVETVTDGTTAQLTGADFDRDDQVTCSVTPSDGTDAGTTVSAGPVTILNTAPVVTGVALNPDPAYVTSTLTCTYATLSDIDGDSVTARYAWFVNGSPLVEEDSSTLAPGTVARGDEVGCMVTPNDGTVDGEGVLSNLVTISNSPPTVSGVTLTPDPAFESSTLTCSAQDPSDPDGDSVSLSYAWTVDGVTVSGQTGATLTGADFDKDQEVICTVVPGDGTDTGDPVSSSPLVIQNTAPVVSSVTLIPSVAFVDTEITCSVSLSDDDPADQASLTAIYAWAVDGVTVEGATGSTLSGAFARGESVVCTATPDDGIEQGVPVTSDPVVISNSAPVADAPSLSPSNPAEESVIECVPGPFNDPDGDTVSLTYAWYVNDILVSGQTGNTLTGADFDKGDTVACEITPSDDADQGTPVRSTPVTVVNTPPTLGSVTLTPATAYRASTLTCGPQDPADVDEDPVTFTYAWTVNGTVLADETGSELNGRFEKHDIVQCEVTPFDGADSGLPVASNSVVILNTPPMPATVTITPAIPYQDDALVAAASSTDPDDDPVTFTYVWYKDDVVQSAYTTDTVPANVIGGGETWRVVATPYDGEDEGTAGEDSVFVLTDEDADGIALENGDCDDTDATVYPDAAEILDGKDNDCNQVTDDRWVALYSYGTPADSFPAIAPDTALAVESDGLTHLYFAGQQDPATAGATLYSVYDPLTGDFGSVQDIDTIQNARYNQVTLLAQDGLPTEVRTLTYDLDGGKIYFQRFDGSTWLGPISPTPLSGVGSSGTAMVTGSDGTDYLLYTTSPGQGGCFSGAWETKLLLASRATDATSFSFLFNPLSSGCGTAGTLVLDSPSMAIGADGVLHVSWYVNTVSRPGDIRYRRVIPGGTSSDNIDALTTGDVGLYSAIAVVPGADPSYPFIAYYDATDETIRMATTSDFLNYVFTTSVAVDSSTLGGSTTPAQAPLVLRFTPEGHAHLVFLANSGFELWYATDETGTWVAEKILTETVSILENHYAMVLDADGNPRILYTDNANGDVHLWKGKIHTTSLPY